MTAAARYWSRVTHKQCVSCCARLVRTKRRKCASCQAKDRRRQHRVYAARRVQGRCRICGKANDQLPYTACTSCYTPMPRTPLFPDLVSHTPEYEAQYRWHQIEQTRAPIEIACCGGWHALRDDGTTSCCGRVALKLRG
jgi:hypothetical protein